MKHIEILLILHLSCIATLLQAQGITRTVTSTFTLQQAVNDINENGSTTIINKIDFDPSLSGTTITLPTGQGLVLTKPVEITGLLDEGQQPTITIKGSYNGSSTTICIFQLDKEAGINYSTSLCTSIKNLRLTEFWGFGIWIADGVNYTKIENCWIGWEENSSGVIVFNHTHGIQNVYAPGILIHSDNNSVLKCVIGGTANAIHIGGDPLTNWTDQINVGATNNLIEENFVGVGTNGVSFNEFGPSNLSDGIFLGPGATNNIVSKNICGDNDSAGIELHGFNAKLNKIINNYLGMNSTFNKRANTHGLFLGNGANENEISGNYIAGNLNQGILLSYELAKDISFGPSNNRIEDNDIGYEGSSLVQGEGITLWGWQINNNYILNNRILNNGYGVLLGGYSGLNKIHGNTIGSQSYGNSVAGICLSQTEGNSIAGNSITYHSNPSISVWFATNANFNEIRGNTFSFNNSGPILVDSNENWIGYNYINGFEDKNTYANNNYNDTTLYNSLPCYYPTAKPVVIP